MNSQINIYRTLKYAKCDMYAECFNLQTLLRVASGETYSNDLDLETSMLVGPFSCSLAGWLESMANRLRAVSEGLRRLSNLADLPAGAVMGLSDLEARIADLDSGVIVDPPGPLPSYADWEDDLTNLEDQEED